MRGGQALVSTPLIPGESRAIEPLEGLRAADFPLSHENVRDEQEP
jgi:hypothetical protein